MERDILNPLNILFCLFIIQNSGILFIFHSSKNFKFILFVFNTNAIYKKLYYIHSTNIKNK